MDSETIETIQRMINGIINSIDEAIQGGLSPVIIQRILSDVLFKKIDDMLYQQALDRGDFSSGYAPAA